MAHNPRDIGSTSGGGDQDSDSDGSLPVLESATSSSGGSDQPDGSEWETDEGEGQRDEDVDMSSPSPYFTTSIPFPFYLNALNDFDDDDPDYYNGVDIDEEDAWSDEDDFGTEDDDFFDEDSELDEDFEDELGSLIIMSIEDLTPDCRAVLRGDEEDVMSEFSGDEKYEPKEYLTGNAGEGETDMYDHTEFPGFDSPFNDDGRLTMNMRQLLIQLDKGKRERERLEGIHRMSHGQGGLLAPCVSTTTRRQFSLHQLILRGPDQPQELAYSPSVIHHPQCGNSLVVVPSNLGLRDDVYTIHEDCIMRCGVLKAMTPHLYEDRLRKSLHNYEDPPAAELVNPSAAPLKTRKATKFVDRSLYDYHRIPASEKLIFTEDELILSMDVRYGYLVLGSDRGTLMTYCLQENAEPSLIYHGPIGPSRDPDDDVMVNSISIVRWPRYHSSTSTNLDHSMDNDTDDEEEDGEPTRRLGEKGLHDHYLVMTGNDKGLFIVSLPDHVNPNTYRGMMGLEEDELHAFNFKQDHTWIRQGFGGEKLNDARVSPDGKWIAIVGDAQMVWVVKVEHTPETEEERLRRQKEEREHMLKELETDESEYESDKEERSHRRHKTEVIEIIAEDPEDASQHTRNAGGSPRSHKTRLLHMFGKPEALRIPDHVLQTPRVRRPGANTSFAPAPRGYTSQYVAWNASSTKFAHTSDSHNRILVWSMPSKQLVCSVDAGGMSFGISFHPKLDNMFAFINRYGFVHVVDVTDCCVGDENFVLPKGKQLLQKTSCHTGQQGGPTANHEVNESVIQVCGPPHYQEKHDVLMTAFRGQQDRRLRILDELTGLSWSSDGRHLYVATKMRVLRYTIADTDVRIPSLFDLCANRAKEWLEQRMLTRHNKKWRLHDVVDKAHQPIPEQWKLVPSWIKQRILGDHGQLRYHDGCEEFGG